MDSEQRPLSPFWNGPLPATGARSATAARAALPSLKKDNCIRRENLKALFVAQENIRLYIQRAGENNVGFLTPTVPCECLSAKEFQRLWHSFLTNYLRKQFPDGMWSRERQPRSGNWHAHCLVDLRRDFRTGFPFNQVKRHFYANVAPWIRDLWKELREAAAKYGFGRIELLPLKYGGRKAAVYATKYTVKCTGSEKMEGEEKCRLFGIWGRVRFVNSKFCFLSSRIIEKRKEWLAADSGLADKSQIKQMFGPHWWFHMGNELMNVIMPEKYYMVLKNGILVWDDLGRTAYEADLAKYRDIEGDEAKVNQCLYEFYSAQGKYMFRDSPEQAHAYVMGRIGRRSKAELPEAAQLTLSFMQKGRSNLIS